MTFHSVFCALVLVAALAVSGCADKNAAPPESVATRPADSAVAATPDQAHGASSHGAPATGAVTPVGRPASGVTAPKAPDMLPPLPRDAFPSARPPEIVMAVYEFAARHPEVLAYVPCFCGCEHAGHRGNEDCFIQGRDPQTGQVTWDAHGAVCAICIDVAQLAMQMHATGAPVTSIRRAIEQKYKGAVSDDDPDAVGAVALSRRGQPRMTPAKRPAEAPREPATTRLFNSLRHGLFIGTVGAASSTSAANTQLKLLLGVPPETDDGDVRPFDADASDRSARARRASSNCLARDGGVVDHLAAPAARRRHHRLGGGDRRRPQPDGRRRLPGSTRLVRDVSERKRLDDQARDLYQQLLQAEKLAALGQTISGVAHELNNPLATILASAERLVAQPADPTLRARPRHHPRRGRARRADRAQPADVRAQAPHDADDGRRESGRARHAGAPAVRAARRATSRSSRRSRPGCRSSSPIRTSSSRCCSI